MGIMKRAGRLLARTTILTVKVAVKTTEIAAKGAVAAGKVAYDHRAQIGKVATTTSKAAATTVAVASYGAYKTAEWGIKKVVEHHQEIGGVVAGARKGLAEAIADAGGHASAPDAVTDPLIERIKRQSVEYRSHIVRVYGRLAATDPRLTRRDVLLDSLVVGGSTLAAYAAQAVRTPPDVERAYQLAYPDLAAHHSFAEAVRRLSTDQLGGFASGVKGKLFEIEYVDYLNDGHLPAGFHAALAGSATQPGWDIVVTGPGGDMQELIQAKATDSVAYVKEALERYPQFDVVTTDEVHSQLVMAGLGDHVSGSGISDNAITHAVEGAADGAAIHFSWMPSILSMALIAFSAYSKEGLDAYEKSKNFGERSARSYLAYLAGGAVAIATNTWWLGILGGVGSRLIIGTGHARRQRLAALREMVASNERVLKRLRAMSNP